MFQTCNSQMTNFTSDSPRRSSRIIIDDKFLLKRLVRRYPYFNVYEGIDIKASKFVTVYVKPGNTDYNFSKKIKECLRNKVSPPLLWSGIHKIQKNSYNVEVHQKYGPSLKSMFNYLKEPISKRDFLLLMYQFIRLIEKYASVGYVYRELDMDYIIFDVKPEQSQLYLLNVFPLKKKGEESQVLNTRFCSKGAHLGLKSSIKDDLESICYILINIHMQGHFLTNTPSQQYVQAKSNLNLNSFKRPLPSLFFDFYSYVINLNYNDEVNYFKWRNIIYRSIGKQALVNPYQWMMAKNKEGQEGCAYSGLMFDQGRSNGDMKEIEDEIRNEDRVLIQKMKNVEWIKNDRR